MQKCSAVIADVTDAGEVAAPSDGIWNTDADQVEFCCPMLSVKILVASTVIKFCKVK